MLVSHPYRFIYLKTSKTAGTSVEMALQPLAVDTPDAEVVEETYAIVGARGIVGRRLIQKNKGRTPADDIWYNHMPARDIREHVGRQIWNRYRKIAVVRNPFDRMISRYHWHVDGTRRDDAYPPTSGMSDSEVFAAFRTFVCNAAWKDDIEVISLNGKPCIDIILRTEHLAADLRTLETTLRLKPNSLTLPVTKAGKQYRRGRCIADYFDDATIAIVRDRMAWTWDVSDYPEVPDGWPVAATGTKVNGGGLVA